MRVGLVYQPRIIDLIYEEFELFKQHQNSTDTTSNDETIQMMIFSLTQQIIAQARQALALVYEPRVVRERRRFVHTRVIAVDSYNPSAATGDPRENSCDKDEKHQARGECYPKI